MAVDIIVPPKKGTNLGSIIGTVLGGIGGSLIPGVGTLAGAAAGASLGGMGGGAVDSAVNSSNHAGQQQGIALPSESQGSAMQRRMGAEDNPSDHIGQLGQALSALHTLTPEVRAEVAPTLANAYSQANGWAPPQDYAGAFKGAVD